MSQEHLLKLLLLNDAPSSVHLRTEHIELVRLRAYLEGEEGDQLKETDQLLSWPQHMRLWQCGDVPDFDLLLIDINFCEDGFAPQYAVNGDEHLTPFGLLHALPLVAWRFASGMPVVWKIHSGNPE